jgi:hypothetical protein
MRRAALCRGRGDWSVAPEDEIRRMRDVSRSTGTSRAQTSSPWWRGQCLFRRFAMILAPAIARCNRRRWPLVSCNASSRSSTAASASTRKRFQRPGDPSSRVSPILTVMVISHGTRHPCRVSLKSGWYCEHRQHIVSVLLPIGKGRETLASGPLSDSGRRRNCQHLCRSHSTLV